MIYKKKNEIIQLKPIDSGHLQANIIVRYINIVYAVQEFMSNINVKDFIDDFKNVRYHKNKNSSINYLFLTNYKYYTFDVLYVFVYY